MCDQFENILSVQQIFGFTCAWTIVWQFVFICFLVASCINANRVSYSFNEYACLIEKLIVIKPEIFKLAFFTPCERVSATEWSVSDVRNKALNLTSLNSE